MILYLAPILLLITVLCEINTTEFVYSEYLLIDSLMHSTTFVLSQKQTNLYWIDELSNVCLSTTAATVYGVSESDSRKVKDLFHHSGTSRKS